MQATSWMTLRNVMLRGKKPDTEEHTLYGSIHSKCPEKAKLQRQDPALWLPGWELEQEMTGNKHTGSFWGDGHTLILDCGNAGTVLEIY